ncbi:MAG: hypothetical protein FJX64_07230 [Alphaproteobacteria bacterium]|nr:hypothetical protein [Alphaproteobacteria bacterium]
MLSWLGLNRAFFQNPVTWLVTAIVAITWVQVVRAARHFDYTCALMAPIHGGGIIYLDTYYVQRSDTAAYEACKGRVPERWKTEWPLADCSPGGRARFSDGRLAFFPQKCRENTGNLWVY